MSGFYSDDFAANETPVSSSDSSNSSALGVFRIIFFALLGITVAKFLARGGSSGIDFYIDFGTLIHKFADAPTIPTDWISFISTNYGETFPWGFQWLGEAIDFFVSVFSGIAFVSVAGSNALIFIFYFLRWILF